MSWAQSAVQPLGPVLTDWVWRLGGVGTPSGLGKGG